MCTMEGLIARFERLEKLQSQTNQKMSEVHELGASVLKDIHDRHQLLDEMIANISTNDDCLSSDESAEENQDEFDDTTKILEETGRELDELLKSM